MAKTDSNFLAYLEKHLGVKEDDIVQKISKMPVDKTLDLIDSVNQDDPDRAKAIMDGPTENNDEDEESSIDPGPKLHDGEEEIEEIRYQPNIGDDVRVQAENGAKEGTVKLTTGPNDTVGVMIDGELHMVKRTKVSKLEEGILGMTALPDIARMRALAGLPAETCTSAPTIETPDSPLSRGPVATEIEFTSAPATLLNPAVPAETVSAGGDDCSCARIDAAFDEIEAALPEMKFDNVKAVRQRLNALLTKLNETKAPRKRKV